MQVFVLNKPCLPQLGFSPVFNTNCKFTFHQAQQKVFKRKLLTPADVKKLKPLVDSLAPQLNSYLKSIGHDQADK